MNVHVHKEKLRKAQTVQKGFKRGYDDLNDHLAKLKKAGLLWTIDSEIDKDRHLHAFVRWGYVGDVGTVLTNNPKRAFLFTNVTDAKGRKYNGDCDVQVGGTAGSPEIYALSMGIDYKGEGLSELSQKIFEKSENAFQIPFQRLKSRQRKRRFTKWFCWRRIFRAGRARGWTRFRFQTTPPAGTVPLFLGWAVHHTQPREWHSEHQPEPLQPESL